MEEEVEMERTRGTVDRDKITPGMKIQSDSFFVMMNIIIENY